MFNTAHDPSLLVQFMPTRTKILYVGSISFRELICFETHIALESQ
jgi:hypothetical protein